MAYGVGDRRASRQDSPEVSVVIPTRDRWDVLSLRALPSALRQESVRLEVIVVDDGSADPAPAPITAGDDRVRVIRHETSRGVPAARNTGIGAARGTWTAFLDDDDLWSPRKLREQLDQAAAEEASLVYSAVAHTNLRGDVLTIDAPPRADELRSLLRAGHVIPGAASNLVARSDLLREIGGFDERLFILEDPDLAIRLAERGRAAACGHAHVAYLQHEGARHLHDIDRLLASFAYFRSKHPDVSTLILENHLRWVLSQHRHAGRKLAAARVCWTVAKHERSPRWFVEGFTYLAGNRARYAARRLKALGRARSLGQPTASASSRDALERRVDWLKEHA